MKNLGLKTKILVVVLGIFILSFVINLLFNNSGLKNMQKSLTEDADTELRVLARKQAEKLGRSLTVMAEGVRENVSEQWKNEIFNPKMLSGKLDDPNSADYKKYLGIIPIVASMRTVAQKANELGIKFKVPKVKARNKINEPTPEEEQILTELKNKRFPVSFTEKDFQENVIEELPNDSDRRNIKKYYSKDGSGNFSLKSNLSKEERSELLYLLKNCGMMDEKVVIKENSIDYYRAVRLDKICLNCHGDPKQSLELWGNDRGEDPTGVKMENWKVGEIHGAFKLTLSLEQTNRLISKSKNLMRQNGEKQLTETTLFTSGVNIVIVIIAAVVIILFINSIIRRIKKIVETIKIFSTGNFTQSLSSDTHDEIGEIVENISIMQGSLSQTLVKVDEMASSLAASSEELNATADQLSQDSQSQAANVEETMASLNEFTDQISSLQTNSQDMAKQGNETLSIAQNSLSLIDGAVEGMKEINNSSQKIVEIVKVINDIADQTNLLSLNAAIEAARAGEHGKGFAVVADEISKLAEKSAQSTKTIEQLVKESQSNTLEGTETVNKTGEAFKEILTNVERTTKNIGFINDIQSQQAESADQIKMAVSNINESTQSQSAALEEMTASFNELSNHAEILKNLMDQFSLSKDLETSSIQVKK